MDELSKKSLKELKQYCKEYNLKGFANKKKGEILKIISSSFNKQDDITNSIANLNISDRIVEKNINTENQNLKKSRGKNCFRNGKIYQASICNKLKKISINGNSIDVKEVEGAKAGPDIVIKYEDMKVGFEVKNINAFEGGSQKMKWDKSESTLVFSENSLHSFILNDRHIYESKNLPYYEGKKTNKDYEIVKHIFNNDIYIDIENNIISKYYLLSGVNYIQIERLGLFHTGNDILNLGVPLFECKQYLRIRTSKHKKNGIPTDVVGDLNYDKKTIIKSKYDIDGNMPPNFKQME